MFRTFEFMNSTLFLELYKSLLCPPYFEQQFKQFKLFQNNKIVTENVQWRATSLQHSMKHLSQSETLSTLGLTSREYRRERADLINVYIVNGIVKIDGNTFFLPFDQRTFTESLQHEIMPEYKRKLLQQESFRFLESLSDSVRIATNHNYFKGRLNKLATSSVFTSSVQTVFQILLSFV